MSGRYLILLLLLSCLAACDGLTPTPFKAEVVVEGYLVAGGSLSPVWLRQTTPVDRQVSGNGAVIGADVQVLLLDEAGGVETAYTYVEDRAGTYVPDVPGARPPVVRPRRTYRLEVRLPGQDDLITATTVVPDTFTVLGVNADTVRYQQGDPFRARVTRSENDLLQNYILLLLASNNPVEEALTPYGRAFFNAKGGGLGNLARNELPPFNESNFRRNPDGTLEVEMPWLIVAFYGANDLIIHVLDQNLFDIVRSTEIQLQGNPSFLPGEIPNVVEHVQGARGVFGSYAAAGVPVYVDRAVR